MLCSAIRTGVGLLALSAALAHAGEIRAQGKVVRVEPISSTSQVLERSGDCEPAKPASDPGLVALLVWDLRAGCRVTRRDVDVVERYRVYYEWDDRVYNTVMTERPADFIPLRVNVR